MHILTIYSLDAFKLISVLDDLAMKKGIIEVIAADPKRLYNDANHEDVSMASITFKCNEDAHGIIEFINSDRVFVCDEDSNDWE